MKKISLQNQPIFLLNGEVIWQASDSSLSEELHGKCVQMLLMYTLVSASPCSWVAYLSFVLLPFDATDFLTTAKKFENLAATVGPRLPVSSFVSVVSSDWIGSPASFLGASTAAGAELSSALSVSLLTNKFELTIMRREYLSDYVRMLSNKSALKKYPKSCVKIIPFR